MRIVVYSRLGRRELDEVSLSEIIVPRVGRKYEDIIISLRETKIRVRSTLGRRDTYVSLSEIIVPRVGRKHEQ